MFEDFIMTSAHKPKEVNVIDELNNMRDSLTTLIFCNPYDFEIVKNWVDKAEGIYEVVKQPYVEKRKIIIVTDKELKKSMLKSIRESKIINNI